MGGVAAVERRGACYHLHLQDASRADGLLKQLAMETRLEHFELLRPSLHNIFIRIAGPVAEAAEAPILQAG